MARFTVLYDEGCELCQRCRAFLEVEPAYVELTLLAAGSDEARLRFGTLPWLGQELVVVAEDGRVWAGAAAFLVCLWALRDYREWSYRGRRWRRWRSASSACCRRSGGASVRCSIIDPAPRIIAASRPRA